LSRGTPFFASQGALQGLGNQAVSAVAQVELGGAEQVAVVLSGEQACGLAGLVEEGLLDGVEEAPDLGLLVADGLDVGLVDIRVGQGAVSWQRIPLR
jgi:hypothetical protein